MKDIIQALHNIRAQADAQMPFVRQEINLIIKSESRNVKDIEKLLDILLDYQFMGVGEKEFNQLNKYYGTFDKQAKGEWEKIQKYLLKG